MKPNQIQIIIYAWIKLYTEHPSIDTPNHDKLAILTALNNIINDLDMIEEISDEKTATLIAWYNKNNN